METETPNCLDEEVIREHLMGSKTIRKDIISLARKGGGFEELENALISAGFSQPQNIASFMYGRRIGGISISSKTGHPSYQRNFHAELAARDNNFEVFTPKHQIPDYSLQHSVPQAGCSCFTSPIIFRRDEAATPVLCIENEGLEFPHTYDGHHSHDIVDALLGRDNYLFIPITAVYGIGPGEEYGVSRVKELSEDAWEGFEETRQVLEGVPKYSIIHPEVIRDNPRYPKESYDPFSENLNELREFVERIAKKPSPPSDQNAIYYRKHLPEILRVSEQLMDYALPKITEIMQNKSR